MLKNNVYKLVLTVAFFLIIGVMGYLYLKYGYNQPPKPAVYKNSKSNPEKNGSPGYLPMWSLEHIQEMVDEEKGWVEDQLLKTPQTEYLNAVSMGIMYHKANDKAGVYGTYVDDQSLNNAIPDIYKYYDLRPIEKRLKLNPRLLLKDLKQQYFIEVTPVQQRSIIQKVIDFNIFNMENPIDYIRFDRKRINDDILYDKALVESDWIAFVIRDAVYFDNTPKNKATIDAYIKWLEDNYLAELQKHPVDKWPWDW